MNFGSNIVGAYDLSATLGNCWSGSRFLLGVNPPQLCSAAVSPCSLCVHLSADATNYSAGRDCVPVLISNTFLWSMGYFFLAAPDFLLKLV